MFSCEDGTQYSQLPFEERNAIIIRYVIYIKQLGRQTLTGRWLLLLRQSFNFLATFVLNVDKIFWGKKKKNNTHKHISFPHLWSISSRPQTKEKSILTVFLIFSRAFILFKFFLPLLFSSDISALLILMLLTFSTTSWGFYCLSIAV